MFNHFIQREVEEIQKHWNEYSINSVSNNNQINDNGDLNESHRGNPTLSMSPTKSKFSTLF